MINLTTKRRSIATLIAVSALLLGFTANAQDADLTMTETPLVLDELPVSVIEQQPVYGPQLQSVIKDEASDDSRLVNPASLQEELPEPLGFEDEELPPMPAEVDVLTRGPLHEAFATAHQADPKSSPVVTKAPPELIEEVPPEYKPEGKNVQWIPGYWAWDDAQSDFIWISGVWRDVPPQRRWVPGYWDEANSEFRWVSGFWAEETQQELGYLPQPPVSIDQGPSTAAPSDNHFYVPGNWQYQNNRYRWLSGHWQPVVENWIWIPARYVWTPSGCIYQSGYWDYDFVRRGTCFAPVYFKRPVYLATNYSYRPSFAINLNIDFLTHLFVRPRCGHYFYGDWYSPNFANFGYRPWVNYRSHFRNYDPLLTYYRCRRSTFNRRINTVQYLAQQHHFYANNIVCRPRPTFAAQFNFINNTARLPNLRHAEFLRKSNYVRTYSNILKTAQRDAQRRSRELVVTNNRLQRELQRQRTQFRRIQEDESRINRRNIEQLANLQRERKKNEVRIASNKINVRTSANRHRTLKLPPTLTKEQVKQIRRDFPNAKRAGNGQLKIEKDRSADLREAIASARKKAAKQQNRNGNRSLNEIANRQRNTVDRQSRANQVSKRDLEKKLAADRKKDRQRNARANEISRNQARDLKRQQAENRNRKKEKVEKADLVRRREEQQRRERQARSAQRQSRNVNERVVADRARQQQEQQRVKQQQQRAQDQIRDRARQAQAQNRAQEQIRKAQERQRQEQSRRAQVEAQKRVAQQRRQSQEQARRAQDQARKAQAERARQARQRQAQQDAARRVQEKAQRDAARQAQRQAQQQKARQDAARRAQQQRQRDAARRAQQQRNRAKSQNNRKQKKR